MFSMCAPHRAVSFLGQCTRRAARPAIRVSSLKVEQAENQSHRIARPTHGFVTAGASLVEMYTALAYDGPALVPRMKRELAECLQRDGFRNVQEAVGADHRKL